MTDTSPTTDRSLQPLWIAGLIVLAIGALAVYVVPPFGLSFLNAREATFDLDPGISSFTASLPATDGSIELQFSPSDGFEVTSPATRRDAETWIVDECASGCRLVVARVDQETPNEPATLTVSYTVNDSEYVDEITIEAGG